MSELDTSVNELNDEIIIFKTQLDKVQSLMEKFKKKNWLISRCLNLI